MGADQKGAPVDVVASSGKVNTSCRGRRGGRRGGGQA